MYQNQSGFKRKTGLEPATSTYSHDEQENFIVLALNGADEILFSKYITKGIGNKTLALPHAGVDCDTGSFYSLCFIFMSFLSNDTKSFPSS